MARIGLFGGTFDPIHTGHIALAEKALAEFALDEIIFLPAGNPPHKTTFEITEKMHRFRMVELAITENPRFSVSDYEIQKETPGYSYLTVGHFNELYPNDEIFFIVGGDSFRNFPSWAQYKTLLSLCAFIVVPRPGIAPESYFENFCGDEDLSRVFFMKEAEFDVSSTEVRESLRKNQIPTEKLPAGVAAYIKTNRLYQTSGV